MLYPSILNVFLHDFWYYIHRHRQFYFRSSSMLYTSISTAFFYMICYVIKIDIDTLTMAALFCITCNVEDIFDVICIDFVLELCTWIVAALFCTICLVIYHINTDSFVFYDKILFSDLHDLRCWRHRQRQFYVIRFAMTYIIPIPTVLSFIIVKNVVLIVVVFHFVTDMFGSDCCCVSYSETKRHPFINSSQLHTELAAFEPAHYIPPPDN